jgi:DNA-binding transcriptional LysR family regulator
MINLELYRTFFTIYREGTLTRAASTLLMTQPGISQQLQNLENYVGKQLFERTSRRMVPTEYGKILYTQIVDPMERLNQIEEEFRGSHLKKESTIKLGSAIEFYSNYLVSLSSISDLAFHVSFGIASELIDKLKKEEIHLAIVSQKIPESGIEYEPLIEEQFVLVGSPSLDRSDFPKRSKSISNLENEKEKWLLKQNWYVYSSDLAIVRRFWKENFQKRPNIKPKMVVPNLNLILESLSAGKGISVIPKYMLQNSQKKFTVFTEFKEVKNTLYFASNIGQNEKIKDLKSKILKIIDKQG